MMDESLGHDLPLVFVKGQPAKLYEMTLPQLRKFVPFLVKCVTKNDLPETSDGTVETPPWWPSDTDFSKEILIAKRPVKDLINTLQKLISSCYSHFSSSYIIAYSASLASGNKSSTGKLSFQEQNDGTTKIIDAKGKLVVVISNLTRHYDNEMTANRSSRRGVRNLEASFNDVAATDFKKSFLPSPRLTRIEEDPDLNKAKENGSVSGFSGTSSITDKMNASARKVVDDITNQLIHTTKSKAQTKTSKVPTRKTTRKRGRADRALESEVIEETSYPIVPEGRDIRDIPDSQNYFAQSLGLIPVKKPCLEIEKKKEEVEPKPVEPERPGPSRILRKVPARSKIAAFLKTHPMPITSLRGQKVLESFGERHSYKLPENVHTLPYEKDCRSTMTKAPQAEATVSTLKKHLLKPGDHVHQYSFGNIQRRLRNVELIMGINVKSFRNFNKCKKMSINVTRISPKVEAEIKKRDELKRQITIARLTNNRKINMILKDFRKDPKELETIKEENPNAMLPQF